MGDSALLEEFPPVTTEAWEQAIRKDLKGADYAKKLLWQTDDGITVKPYYRAEDLAGLEYLDSAPGEFPYLRGTASANQWRIREEIEEASAKDANRRALEALAAGAEEISFRLAVPDRPALDTLLAGLTEIRIHFRDANESLLEMILQAEKPALGSADWNPFQDLDLAADFARRAHAAFRPITISGSYFEESGGTTVQELGYTLAAGIDFLAEMQKRGVAADCAAAAVAFLLSIGSNYFFQIAKLRAFRQLWAQAVNSFGGSHNIAKAEIHARSSRWNKTIYDAHVNVLRGTTEAMAAALGGADSMAVAPFDEVYKRPDDASRRLARNTQIILKKEAHLDRVADAGGGSYYIEVLTDSLARESWKLMQEIEAAGGYAKVLGNGGIQAELAKARAAKETAVAFRRQIFLGTNQYPNLAEKAPEPFEPRSGDNLRRGPQAFEEIRLRTERYTATTGRRCRFLLAEIGDAKMRAARSAFAANFFGCAGFEVTIQSFPSVDAIATAEAEAIVLCSSDAEYANLAPALLRKLKDTGRATPVMVAGFPANSVEVLEQAGVADFIHLRSNAVETLAAWQKRLGCSMVSHVPQPGTWAPFTRSDVTKRPAHKI
jgi:methylmalonyl-CoA mutase